MSFVLKAPKKTLPPVIGYVHELSRIQQGPKSKWFDMKLQTGPKTQLRTVCFSNDKYSLFAKKATTITPAKISNYIMWKSLDGQEDEILINDMTLVQTPSQTSMISNLTTMKQRTQSLP